MSPIKISSASRQKTCSVTRAGIGIPQSIINRTGWQQGRDRVEVGFIAETVCILLSKPSQSLDSFLVSYANSRKSTGGRIACQAFIRYYLQTLIVLPQRNVTPIFIEHALWRIAFLLGDVQWSMAEFSQAGLGKVKRGTPGVYQLLGKNNVVLRIGEGKITERISTHLKDSVRFGQVVLSFGYIELSTKEDCEVMEKILLARYEAEQGGVPPLNEIRA